jgi:glycosyltransferase involved in cell wall biosynthesis
MNILWFIWRDFKHPSSGGEGVHLGEVASRLVRLGHNVTVFSSNFPGAPKDEEVNGIRIIRTGSLYSVYFYALFRYLSKFKGKYDIIIDEINTVPFFTCLYSKTPKIAFIHQLGHEVFLEAPLNRLQKKIIYHLEPYLIKRYKNTHVVTVSESTRRDLIEIGIPSQNITVIYNGVNVLCEPLKDFSEKSQYPHVIYVGRVVPQKGLHFIIKAMSKIVKKYPDAIFSIVGRCLAKGYELQLQKLARSLGIESNIRLLGFVSEKVKVNLLKSAHVFAIQSVREGWGLSAMEASACGTPVIASNVPGLKECVLNGETGYLVPRGDVHKLAEKLQLLLDWANRGDVRYAHMARRAAKWAGQFSWEKTAEKFSQILEMTLSRG